MLHAFCFLEKLSLNRKPGRLLLIWSCFMLYDIRDRWLNGSFRKLYYNRCRFSPLVFLTVDKMCDSSHKRFLQVSKLSSQIYCFRFTLIFLNYLCSSPHSNPAADGRFHSTHHHNRHLEISMTFTCHASKDKYLGK